MKVALGFILAYAASIVLLTGAWPVAVWFTAIALLLAGSVKTYVVFLPRYHAHILWKITEAEVKLEELNRGQIS